MLKKATAQKARVVDCQVADSEGRVNQRLIEHKRDGILHVRNRSFADTFGTAIVKVPGRREPRYIIHAHAQIRTCTSKLPKANSYPMGCTDAEIGENTAAKPAREIQLQDLPGKVGAIACESRVTEVAASLLNLPKNPGILLCGCADMQHIAPPVPKPTDVLSAESQGDQGVGFVKRGNPRARILLACYSVEINVCRDRSPTGGRPIGRAGENDSGPVMALRDRPLLTNARVTDPDRKMAGVAQEALVASRILDYQSHVRPPLRGSATEKSQHCDR